MYGKLVFGRRIAIAQQTVAEVRYGAIAAGWGERRLAAVERLLHRSRVLPADDEATWAYARLRHQCRPADRATTQLTPPPMRPHVPIQGQHAVRIRRLVRIPPGARRATGSWRRSVAGVGQAAQEGLDAVFD